MATWYLLLIMQNVELLLMAMKQYFQHGTPACQLLMVYLYLLQLSCYVSKLLLRVVFGHLQIEPEVAGVTVRSMLATYQGDG